MDDFLERVKTRNLIKVKGINLEKAITNYELRVRKEGLRKINLQALVVCFTPHILSSLFARSKKKKIVPDTSSMDVFVIITTLRDHVR